MAEGPFALHMTRSMVRLGLVLGGRPQPWPARTGGTGPSSRPRPM